MAVEQVLGQIGRAPRTAQTEGRNFIPFSKIPEYRKVNRDLLSILVGMLPDNFVHVDVASGTGLVAQEMTVLCHAQEKRGKIICVEPDPYAVKQARKDTPSTDLVQVEFIQGKGEDLEELLAGKIPEEGVDSVSIHDAIHEITGKDEETGVTNKQKVLSKMSKITKIGGFISLNSAFTTEGLGGDGFGYGKWSSHAFRLANGRIRRDRKEIKAEDEKDESTKVYEPIEYLNMSREAGFGKIIVFRKKPVTMTHDALVAISMYPRFSEGIFENYEPNPGAEIPDPASQSDYLIQSLNDKNITELGRVWRDYLLEKTSDSPWSRAS
ncbi:MAG: hypothetical protein A3C27_01790 [Candidatus Levybacteria bacterium RIFCSPHIGHO2_02_FULL_39_36]|nr:MAG: hypothetical protein UT20_C0007G0035 [Candidatus Levybacteria bacterium GW2011_GWA1_39_11]KKR24746.1 MAG: hypothetical protein UT56_C0009G0011 [Candidatus Levybacteria bacterium GW2011_GWB1_39_7]KKR26669.1 MAG: hypothetical protein UT57_C0029G0008 [Microgenomates group bacterium GW2011_GWC1_39_7]OGH15238.1 MAG: hypothetical protein A2689_00970 [Candidatus Levybacteria bacterium RIFCSPHIGHO2_01_FULL_38_96]OGH25748.1 MAG: hypothetical protein A3E68_01705 [Candidatus Levybacteria bacterium